MDIPLAYMFLLRAKQIPFPKHLRLFIENGVYDVYIDDMFSYCAFYMKDYDVRQ